MQSLSVLAVAALAAAGAATALPRASSEIYSDRSGDGGAAPDIGAVSVSNDDTGAITFRIGLLNRVDLLGLDQVDVHLDADRNRRTGDRFGAEYRLSAKKKNGVATFRVQDRAGRSLPLPAHGLSRSVLTFTVRARDLGGLAAFRFRIRSSAGQRDGADEAPDVRTGQWEYRVKIEDREPPTVTALPSAGERGGYAKLRYEVIDDSAWTREHVTVYRGARRLATIRSRFGPAEPGMVYFVTWRVPRRLSAGALTFCVRSSDKSGKKSDRSCAPLRVS